MTCSAWDADVEALIAGSADTETARRVERHLDRCPDCRTTVDAGRRLRRAVDDLPRSIEPGQDLWPAIAERLVDRPNALARPVPSGPAPPFEGDRRERGTPSPGWWPWARGALAALALIALGAGLQRWWDVPSATDDARPTAAVAASSGDELQPLATYRRASAELRATVLAREDRFSAETRALVERNLSLIEGAITELEVALRADPGNGEIELLLVARYRQEVELLQRLVS